MYIESHSVNKNNNGSPLARHTNSRAELENNNKNRKNRDCLRDSHEHKEIKESQG
jgi:hypothetical protein